MPQREWAVYGGICGLLSVLLGLGAVLRLRSMPGSAARTVAEFLNVAGRPEARLSTMLPGFLGALGSMFGIVLFWALQRVLSGGSADSRSVLPAFVGALFGTIGLATVIAKFFVESRMMVDLGRLYGAATSETEREILVGIFKGFRPIERGLHFSYDTFLTLGIVLVGWAMVTHVQFGKVLGLSGIAVGLSVLAIRLWSWMAPTPLSPAIRSLLALPSLWFLAVSIQLLRLANRLTG